MVDALYLIQSAQQAGLEVLEPVSKWGSQLSPQAQQFFATGEQGTTSVSVSFGQQYFHEALRLQDPNALRSAVSAILSIVRGNPYLYQSFVLNHDSSSIRFLHELLKFPDTILVDKVAALLSGIMCRHSNHELFTQRNFNSDKSNEKSNMTDLVRQVANYNNGSESGKMNVLANLLKNDQWRVEIFDTHAMRILSGTAAINHIPTAYKSVMCLWLASYSKEVEIPSAVVVSINELLKSNSRAEKVVRICLMALENMMKFKSICEAMAENDTINIVSSLEYEKWRDPELVELIARVKLLLQNEVKVLTSFERFEREVMGGKLKWGFIHSDKFWVENVLKFERNNFRIIDHLMVIVRTSRDCESLSVACHDLGEFARLHPMGKLVMSRKGAKEKMLELMSSSQREVAREALLCVQKLMLQKGVEVGATAVVS